MVQMVLILFDAGVTYMIWKKIIWRLEEGLLFVTDVSTTCAEAIFRVKW